MINKFFGVQKQVVSGGIVAGATVNLDAGNASSYSGSGTDWFDLTANNNDGVLVNGVTYSASNGGILDFDGVNDYVNMPETYGITTATNTPFTIECIFYIDSWKTTYPRLFNIKSDVLSSSTSALTLIYPQTYSTFKTIAWAYSVAPGSLNTMIFDNGFVLSSSTWYHMILTWDGVSIDAATSWKLYLNSVSKTVSTILDAFGIAYQYNVIGARVSTAGEATTQWSDAKIPVFNFYNNKEFNQTEVTQNFDFYKSRYGL